MPDGPSVRRARDEDVHAAAALLYLTSPGGFILFGGSERRGLRLIEAAFRTPGTDTSRDVVTVAELAGGIAGAMAAFPAREADERRRHFLRVALRHRPPWRWAQMVRVAREGMAQSPIPPQDAVYIDALATGEAHRRRGVAVALLEQAERQARAGGFGALALDTTAANDAARALYERFGFEVAQEIPARRPIPAMVGYVKRLERACSGAS